MLARETIESLCSGQTNQSDVALFDGPVQVEAVASNELYLFR